MGEGGGPHAVIDSFIERQHAEMIPRDSGNDRCPGDPQQLPIPPPPPPVSQKSVFSKNKRPLTWAPRLRQGRGRGGTSGHVLRPPPEQRRRF